MMLTEHTMQRQYTIGGQMMIWMAAGCARIMAVMAGNWLGVLAIGWIYAPPTGQVSFDSVLDVMGVQDLLAHHIHARGHTKLE